MRRKGSMDMDMIFSIFILILMVIFIQQVLANINSVNKKMDVIALKKEIIRDESECEKEKLGNFNNNIDELEKEEKYEKNGWAIIKERNIIEGNYGYVSTKITLKKGCEKEDVVVYGILGEEKYENSER